MNAPDAHFLPDIQSRADLRNLPIDQVGVKGLRYPVRVRMADGAVQSTVASVAMTVALPAEVKGTHMSRFVEVLEGADLILDLASMKQTLDGMLARLGATYGEIEFAFPCFLRKAAPVSGVKSLLDYEVNMRAGVKPGSGYQVELKVCVAATSLCPCSKEISAYGAHNQRSHIVIAAVLCGDMGIEELVRIAEEEASCEVYGLLKRPDEKYVTERAYDNPKFVEDLVRDVAARLNAEPRVSGYTVSAENFESIHNHSAYALISRDKSLFATTSGALA
ncbi:MAG: GTP cyclohydrolase FolE2 [Burkholderiales bacterium]